MSNPGSVSLESALRTCKVNTAYANRIESDRFLNPNNMVCPVWNGTDLTGRSVCPDSFYTKRAGCNSAEDRISVENNVSRPQYMEYITLSANGIRGNMYGGAVGPQEESQVRTNELNNISNITGGFGQNFGGVIYPNCGAFPYANAMNRESEEKRKEESYVHSSRGYNNRRSSGN